MSFNFEDIRDEISSVDLPGDAALVSPEESEKRVSELMKQSNLARSGVGCALAIICQKGGTSKRAQGTIYAVVNSKKRDLAMIRRAMTNLNCKFTLRQWARTHGKFIFDGSLTYSLHGDLAKKVGRNYDSLTQEELIWMSNFQMDNSDCPANLRELLKEHYNTLFPNKNMELQRIIEFKKT